MRSLWEDPLSATPGNASKNTSEVFSLFDVRATLSVASTRSPIDGVMVQPRPTEASGARKPNGDDPAPSVGAPPSVVLPPDGPADKPDAVPAGVGPGVCAFAKAETTNTRPAITVLEPKPPPDHPERVEEPEFADRPKPVQRLGARADRASTKHVLSFSKGSARTGSRGPIAWLT